MSDLLNLFAIIIVFGVILWVVNVFIPMPGAIKSLLNLLVLIVLIIYILQFFGLIHNVLPTIRLFK
ncbi:Uncharacterised protein [Legionella donaldsonii]|uniref:Transmembrane protein n=1 Tax=Legionella donaldsonii TaxID=45060 RepID=A0A378J736_9GAMM|nr:Thivi_2564 family membrane protein [Legionella donaldsonii]STX43269.1 Uncharacterised protein [Legionella donaldsonii]